MTDVSRKQGQYSVIVRSLLYVHPRTAIYAPTSYYTIVCMHFFVSLMRGVRLLHGSLTRCAHLSHGNTSGGLSNSGRNSSGGVSGDGWAVGTSNSGADTTTAGTDGGGAVGGKHVHTIKYFNHA
jgi:hypothetical protein